MLRGFEKDYEKYVTLYKKFKRMVDDSSTAMYKDCKPEHTKMATVLELLQMKENFKWSDRSVTVLLRFCNTFFQKETKCPGVTTKLNGSSVRWDWKLRKFMLVKMIVCCSVEMLIKI